MARKSRYRNAAGGVMTSDSNPREARIRKIGESGGICTDIKSGDTVFFTWEEHRDFELFPELIDYLKAGNLKVGDAIIYNRRVRNLKPSEIERERRKKEAPKAATLAGRLRAFFWRPTEDLRMLTGGCATDLAIAAAYWYVPKAP
ncbi:hypothetical protein KBC55_00665 [Patescibacteria group bacterium]|nr:hypothetical protein [Patescibacteria group bacterium]